MSGLKIAGCCVHVASVIYLFSIAKYKEIKLPGEYLNSIFVDMNKMEPANKPRYVRARRGAHETSSSDESSVSDELSDFNDFSDTSESYNKNKLCDSNVSSDFDKLNKPKQRFTKKK